MNINQLILIVKKKISENVTIENLQIEDKSFLHKKHKNHQEGKFHLKVIIKSKELAKISKILATKKIYNILKNELKENIHSIQLIIN